MSLMPIWERRSEPLFTSLDKFSERLQFPRVVRTHMLRSGLPPRKTCGYFYVFMAGVQRIRRKPQEAHLSAYRVLTPVTKPLEQATVMQLKTYAEVQNEQPNSKPN